MHGSSATITFAFNLIVMSKLKMSYLWLSYYGWRISPARAMWVCTTLPYPPAIAPAPGTSWPPPRCSALPQPLTTPQYPAGMGGEPQGLLALIHSAGKPAWWDRERQRRKVIYSVSTVFTELQQENVLVSCFSTFVGLVHWKVFLLSEPSSACVIDTYCISHVQKWHIAPEASGYLQTRYSLWHFQSLL